eukprot:TRINITY_DN19571_c0_g1_i1.p1 TRINITY_DN19571_c0_g1~~TRINITY_DN19571_c0_g1_i1.p1  ORF type:complete len:254 (+),score=44.93 TRINITY_DN19571_c0_g1_i1:60-764(+)
MASSRIASRVAKTVAASGAGFATWSIGYQSVCGAHEVRLEATYILDTDVNNGFKVMSDPRLLDDTTPWWFHIVMTKASAPQLQALMKHVDSVLAGLQQTDAEPDSFLLNYWVFFGYVMPVPWTSDVFALDRVADKFRLSYRQKLGPYRSFEHTHLVSAGLPVKTATKGDPVCPSPASCVVEDSIVASVLGEPLLNNMCSILLAQILIARGRTLTAAYGGRVLHVGRAYEKGSPE